MAVDESDKNTSNELAHERTGMASDRTRWAADRTLWAADRTFIAWLRTAISLIGFGFAIAKAGDAMESQGIYSDSVSSLQVVGLAFIALAVLGLAGALVQEIRITDRLAKQGFPRMEPIPLATVMGALVLLVGILGAIFVFV